MYWWQKYPISGIMPHRIRLPMHKIPQCHPITYLYLWDLGQLNAGWTASLQGKVARQGCWLVFSMEKNPRAILEKHTEQKPTNLPQTPSVPSGLGCYAGDQENPRREALAGRDRKWDHGFLGAQGKFKFTDYNKSKQLVLLLQASGTVVAVSSWDFCYAWGTLSKSNCICYCHQNPTLPLTQHISTQGKMQPFKEKKRCVYSHCLHEWDKWHVKVHGLSQMTDLSMIYYPAIIKNTYINRKHAGEQI